MLINFLAFQLGRFACVCGCAQRQPICAEYRMVYVDPEYQRAIIGRNARDDVWPMARSPELEPSEYAELEPIVAEVGYDPARLRTVP